MESNKISEEECIFCNRENLKNKVLFETTNWIAIYDGFPVSNGHTLLIPKGHYRTIFDLPLELWDSLPYRIFDVKRIIDAKYHPSGYNIGVNVNESAGQSVMHCHIHIIPRYDGDVENPRGGVRGVIPSRMNY